MNFNQKIDWLIELHGDTFLECPGCEDAMKYSLYANNMNNSKR